MEQEWWVYHTYRRLADEGKVRHLLCPDCETQLVTRLNSAEGSEDVWLWCSFCDSMKRPGLNIYAQILAVVKEHL